jgi:hypothetical protein
MVTLVKEEEALLVSKAVKPRKTLLKKTMGTHSEGTFFRVQDFIVGYKELIPLELTINMKNNKNRVLIAQVPDLNIKIRSLSIGYPVESVELDSGFFIDFILVFFKQQEKRLFELLDKTEENVSKETVSSVEAIFLILFRPELFNRLFNREQFTEVYYNVFSAVREISLSIY